jgi:hypothetical protein
MRKARYENRFLGVLTTLDSFMTSDVTCVLFSRMVLARRHGVAELLDKEHRAVLSLKLDGTRGAGMSF